MNWIKISERLPQTEDSDESGHVWAFDTYGKVCSAHIYCIEGFLGISPYTHWMPKPKLPPPPPPEDIAESEETIKW